MENNVKPTIVFLTSGWTGVDKNIREGKSPSGVPSISKAWTIFCQKGWNVHVFMQTDVTPDWPAETTELNGVIFHWIQPAFYKFTKWLMNHRLYGWFKIFWLISQIRMANRLRKSKVKPDVIYSMRSVYALLGYFWARLRKCKIVLREYGTFGYDAWFVNKSWSGRLLTLGPLLLFKIPFDLFIMTNDGTQGDKVAKWANFDMNKFWFPINGVNKNLKLENFNKADFKEKIGIPRDYMMLMTLGRLTSWKRLDRIIDAMPDVLMEYPKTTLVVVGSGESKDAFKERAVKLGVSESIKFIGAVTNDEIKYYLNTTDLFLMPYDVSNLSNTLIEALTAGCCVVTRDVGSTTEIVKDDDNAVVLSHGEADDFAQAVIKLLKDPERRNRLATKAHRQAMERFVTWEERMENEFVRINELIQK